MAAALPWIMAIGSVVSAAGAINQGRAAQNAANFNAAVDARNAAIARQQAAADAVLQQQHARRVIGKARAAYGAAGITGEGSPLDVLESSAASAEYDRQNILYKGELRAMGYADDSALQIARGSNAMAAAEGSAASSLLMGGSKAYEMGLGRASPQAGYSIGSYNNSAGDYSTGGLA